MPWARVTLGRLKGGADRVTCETCHGAQRRRARLADAAVSRRCRSPTCGIAAGRSTTANIDAQMRNAIYGYLAESDKQAKAAYMREIVMPGMARLLHRPAYDFTRTYEYNRSRRSLGCYHCHRVK